MSPYLRFVFSYTPVSVVNYIIIKVSEAVYAYFEIWNPTAPRITYICDENFFRDFFKFEFSEKKKNGLKTVTLREAISKEQIKAYRDELIRTLQEAENLSDRDKRLLEEWLRVREIQDKEDSERENKGQ